MIEKLMVYLKQQKELYGSDFLINEKQKKQLENILYPCEMGTNLGRKEKTVLSQNAKTLDELKNLVETCQNCHLGICRNKFVFGKGNPKAPVMIVGEAPGADEDRQGIPFVGKAGQLLDKILESIQLTLEDVFITNIVKCRPPDNRDPKEYEISSCAFILEQQYQLVQPQFVLALGRVAARTLLKSQNSLSKLRGCFYRYRSSELLVTYHPSALLRNEEWKRPTWEDMKMLQARLKKTGVK